MTSRLVVNNIDNDTGVTTIRLNPTYSSFELNSAERFRIKSDGKVGVNTDGPSQQFTSYASSGYPVLANGPSNGIGLGGNGAIVFGTKDLGSYGPGILDGSTLEFKISGSPKLNITSGGSIGIGTNNPATEVHLYGNAPVMTVTPTNWQSGLRLNVVGLGYHASNNQLFRVQRDGTTKLQLNEDGDLVITGDDNAELKLKCGTTTGNGIIAFLNSSGSTKGNIFYDTDDNFMVFKTNGSASANERLRIKSDGDIEATGNLKTNNLSGRNIIVNGAMQVAQRKPSGEFTGQAGYATVDRMMGGYAVPNTDPITECHVLTSGDTGPWEKGFRKSYRMKIGYQGTAGAGHYYQFQYRMEGQDIAVSGWDYTSPSSYITLSFWIKSSVAYNPSWYLRAKHGTAKIYRWQPGTLSANTWTKVTKTFPGNSGLTINNDNTEGLQLNLSPYWGTNYSAASPNMDTWENFVSASRAKDTVATWFETNGATMEVTGLQLEVGSIATEFEHKSYAEELRLCQRYCFRLGGGDTEVSTTLALAVQSHSTTAKAHIQFPVTMRSKDINYTKSNLTLDDDVASYAAHRVNSISSDQSSTTSSTLIFNTDSMATVNPTRVVADTVGGYIQGDCEL